MRIRHQEHSIKVRQAKAKSQSDHLCWKMHRMWPSGLAAVFGPVPEHLELLVGQYLAQFCRIPPAIELAPHGSLPQIELDAA
jgi:hypothetical protein